MATIKTQIVGGQRRIITKVLGGQRRISCSCCDQQQGCCMYPADQFDILYGFDDLPDIIQCEVGEFSEAYKVNDGDGAVYKTPWLPIAPPNNTSLHRIEIGGNWILSTPDFDGIESWVPMGTETAPLWRMTLRVEEEDNMRGLFPENGCLFGGLFLGGDPWPSLPPLGNWNRFVQDNFEDTYTITTPFSSGTVIRQNLCLWNGIDGNGCPLQLLYGGFGGDPETEPAESALKWSVEFQKFESPVEGQPEICTVNYGRLKSGFQNSPTGTYDIPYTTEGPESATVS